MDQATEALYREREKRIMDAVQLKVPDRVPISIPFSYFPAKFAGITAQDAYYDLPKWKQAYLKAVEYFQPDRVVVISNQSGKVLEGLDSKTLRWPGHGVSPYHTHQFVEGEYMLENEYDLFLSDMGDFLVRYFLPRSYGSLEPLGHLPHLNTLLQGLPFHNLATPEFADMLENLAKNAREAVRWQTEVGSITRAITEKGYFCRMGLGGGVPFDTISDFLRGMRGAMLDMYRRPDKLLAACDMLSNIQIERIKAAPRQTEFTTSFIALHRGAEGFMSKKQFETFYWPYLKRLINALVEAGSTPDIFFEGDYTSRLEYLRELPQGKIIARFDRTDMKKAKEILGGRICIAGNVFPSLLQTGSAEDVRTYCKWLIDVVGKDGGYIMTSASALDEVDPRNLKTMIDFTKDYGRYFLQNGDP
jgi:uroporphyrinogen-III decarboxylase